jgi:peptidoglycan hydrolase-like protein with peptidoglycan-binding domain
MRRPHAALSFLALALPPAWVFPPALAADAEGRFMVKGGGRASCQIFLGAQQARSPEFVSLAGWIDGYLTALNQSEHATYDIAPWQGTELLLAAISSECRRDPAQSFHTAAFRVTESLRAARLIEHSELVTATVGETSVVLYREVVRRIQERLRLRGLFAAEPDGNYDGRTIEAMKAFQAEKELPVTGLPDQVTLARLL